MIEFGLEYGFTLRFTETMPIGMLCLGQEHSYPLRLLLRVGGDGRVRKSF